MRRFLVIMAVSGSSALFFCRQTPVRQETQTPAPAASVESGLAYLGILFVVDTDAVRVVEIFPDSPASKSGLVIGDTILSANGKRIAGMYSFKAEIRSLRPGDPLQMLVIRPNGRRQTILATLERQPDDLARWRGY